MPAAPMGSPTVPNEPTFILSIKPAPGCDGPLLVSDDQHLVRMVVDAIRRTYAPSRARPVQPLRPEKVGA